MDTTESTSSWYALAESLHINGRAFIGGEFRDAQSGRNYIKDSPVDGRRLGDVVEGDSADIDRAVRCARQAFDEGHWARCHPRERKRILLRYAEAVEAHRDELAALITLEMGKPIRDSLVEVDLATLCITYYAESIDKIFGEVAPTAVTVLALVTKEPVGVVGAVTPWNYPLLMPVWKLAPALAMGNSIVIKPAEQSPLSAIYLGKIACEAEVPAGVLNVVPGFGEAAGSALGLHMDVDVLTFTGSTEVGKAFLRYSGESNMKAVSLECGGKSPHIILSDLPSLEAAARAAAEGVFANAGQSCNAGTRLVVEKAIEDELLAKLMIAAKPWYPLDPFDERAQMGAIVDEVQMRRIEDYVEAGCAEGAELAVGGARASDRSSALYYEPTIFRKATNHMRIARDEIFGPVLTVISVENAQEAVSVANDSEYGLAAGVWTSDITKAHRMARDLRAGSVYINCYDRSDIAVPFGGLKRSGIGIDKSLHALEKYVKYKTTWVSLDDNESE